MGKVRSKDPSLVFLFVLIMVVLQYGNASDTNERGEKKPECIRLPPQPPNPVSPSGKIDLFRLLQEDDQNKNIIVTKDHQADDVILILGNTGSGKTTIAQVLAGNLSRIHSAKTESGNVVIIDDEDRIGLPSTNSKTISPELVIRYDDNSTTTTAFVDCPGFTDSRGSEMDIAVNFLMNQKLKSVKSVKMLFLTKYSSVKLGNRLDFDSLANHATTFVKNLTKYKDSFGLVVTMVKSYDEEGEFVKDSQVKRGIVEFLQIYKRDKMMKLQALRNNSSGDDDDHEHLERKIFFVDTLLQRNNDNAYHKISFSRSPRCGPLKKSALVQQTRSQITKMYSEAISYTTVDDHGKDFGFTLKDKTILDVQNFYTERLNQQITQVVETIVRELTFSYTNTYFSSNAPNVTKLSKQLHKDSATVKKFAVKFESRSAHEFIECFISTLQTMGYGPPSELIHSLKEKQRFLNFFEESVSGTKHGQSRLGDPRMWVEPVARFQKMIQEHRDYYDFLANLDKTLQEYSIHENRQFENINIEVKDPLDWLTYIEKESIIPIGSYVTSICEKMSSQNLQHLDSLMKIFTTPTEISCAGENNLKIVGSYVKLSEFVNEKGIVFTNDSACNLNTLKLIEVYGQQTIFVDRDINGLGRELSIVLVAPKWSIIGNRTFHLEGSDAPDFEPPQAKSGTNESGENGDDGRLGIPGNPGGSLLGMALVFDGAGNLQILASGGKGGNGQNGGHGGTGWKGHDARDVDDSDWDWNLENVVNIIWTARRSGGEGSRGGNGGKGGSGGFGGHPGYVDLITPDGKTKGEEKIETVRERGSRGQNGLGGKGGHGGAAGLDIYCVQTQYFFFITIHGKTCSRDSSGSSGVSGNQGLIESSQGKENAKFPDLNIDKTRSRSVRDYVKWVRNVENQVTQGFVTFIQTRY